MIKFEEREGELFRMLDKPVPLTDDAELPVLVRMIQDDTMLGKANKRNCHPDALAQKIICIELTDGGLFLDGYYAYRYEIIGTPVAEGSAEWALYHAINGEIVTMDDCGIYKIQNGKLWECFPNDSNEWRVVADDGYGYWLEYIHDPTGWQIYTEPKPEPGDWVEFIDAGGRKSQGKYLSNAHDNAILVRDTTYNARCVVPTRKIIRKLSPSEVVIHIGCLEGTVEDLSYASDGRFWLIGKATERRQQGMFVLLYDEMLDTQTRELVEGLLKAQEKGE